MGAHLQVLLLRVENRGSETVDLLGVEPSEDGAVWTPEEALDQVRQVGALYLLYPVAPGLLASHYSASSATSLDAIPAAAFRALALVGLMVGAGNLVVAELAL